ncbi:unnamed protein product [Ceratitis capitata]|uniref:(Mediterranean fruit fly) hypothetical protein n=1 Tax=Ceratitis capitata TaxID=7213 RepID=A0A811U9R4_CERCA|nr:unnamed protein product [Ceratitis capitata]
MTNRRHKKTVVATPWHARMSKVLLLVHPQLICLAIFSLSFLQLQVVGGIFDSIAGASIAGRKAYRKVNGGSVFEVCATQCIFINRVTAFKLSHIAHGMLALHHTSRSMANGGVSSALSVKLTGGCWSALNDLFSDLFVNARMEMLRWQLIVAESEHLTKGKECKKKAEKRNN